MSFKKRKPYEPVKELFQIPIALFEVLSLIEEAQEDGCEQAFQMKELMESIINTALNDPQAWLKIAKANAVNKPQRVGV